jgi:hypothetical protein
LNTEVWTSGYTFESITTIRITSTSFLFEYSFALCPQAITDLYLVTVDSLAFSIISCKLNNTIGVNLCLAFFAKIVI